jgi:molecular chaperone HtpG
MTETTTNPEGSRPIPFKAETRQLLNILIHSLYTDREIFLRELISNASDALVHMNFEMLTNREVKDPQLPLEIRIIGDPDNRTLTIKDTGIGMTREELVENLGTIARSGARDFIQAAAESKEKLSDIIGQFGVGFYSAFMVAESIRVTSRSYKPDAEAAAWVSSGEDTFEVEPASKAERGTEVEIKLKEDAVDFAREYKLREIIVKHSDFIGFPIYFGEQAEQVNRQTALWRQNPREVKENEYNEFYKQLTLDAEPPLALAHMVVDAPAQMYALLFVPGNPERYVFSPRHEAGLKLFSRKILIQDYCKDLLPEYFGFIQGVVDSEDLPLNISRESIQSNRVMVQLKKLVTNKIIDTLKSMAKDKPEDYAKFWNAFSRAIKQGVATEQVDVGALYPLLRFHTTTHPQEWSSLHDIVERMKPGQDKLYYILGEDDRSIPYSPHLDPYRKRGVEVLIMTDPMDSFMLLQLIKYKDFELVNVASTKTELPKSDETEAEEKEVEKLDEKDLSTLIQQIKTTLGDRVTDVRSTDRLSDSPARLVDPEGSPDQSIQRVYRLLNKDFEVPKKVLEINPRHAIMTRLSALPADDPRCAPIIEQVYENALLIEGIHPDPASMIGRIQKIMEDALK